MLRLYSKITFTKYDLKTKKEGDIIIFNFVNNIEVETSYEDLTDTASITIPRKLNFDGKPIATQIDSIFKRGDKVKIEMGYFPELRTVFEGFISTVSINAPIQIECEDQMFLLKQKPILYPLRYGSITKGKRGGTLKHPKIIPTKIKLKDFLNDVLLDGTGIDFKCLLDVEINVKRFNSSAAKVLDTLKSEYGFYSYFVDGVLNVGLASDTSDTNTVDFEFEHNIIDDSSLKYQRETDIRLRVKAESIDSKTNARKVVEVGDDDGALKDFKIQNATEAELKTFADLKLKEFKYEGYTGRFTTFGEDYIRHGDAANLVSKRYPEKNGVYQCKSVKRIFGMNGYRQIIELGIKLKN
ncbi:MAG: hypothetical protein K0S53_405 [Bacteroidetes bacterium]|jgi:hypothetical protein|nr:hypothetical protein [Bacteroidota bacterium]